ncbi:MAG: Ku protein, partial [Actinobacteria bacterium]|nr:Ku protein [Actinomycetota bacterium]
AETLVETLAADFDPTRFDDEYTKAVEELIASKRQQTGTRPAAATGDRAGVPDLLTALKRSVEEASGGAGRPGATTKPPG